MGSVVPLIDYMGFLLNRTQGVKRYTRLHRAKLELSLASPFERSAGYASCTVRATSPHGEISMGSWGGPRPATIEVERFD